MIAGQAGVSSYRHSNVTHLRNSRLIPWPEVGPTNNYTRLETRTIYQEIISWACFPWNLIFRTVLTFDHHRSRDARLRSIEPSWKIARCNERLDFPLARNQVIHDLASGLISIKQRVIVRRGAWDHDTNLIPTWRGPSSREPRYLFIGCEKSRLLIY